MSQSFLDSIGLDDPLDLSWIITTLQTLSSVIFQVLQFLFGGLVKVLGYGSLTNTGVLSFMENGITVFFKNIFSDLLKGIITAGIWIEARLRPIIDWLKKLQQRILDFYTKYIRPIIILIQRIRQFLAILRQLGIHIADKLDKILGTIQNDLQGAFLKIVGVLNATIDVLNILTDPSRFLRHPTMVLSIRRSFTALIRQVTGLPPAFFFPSPRKSAPQGIGQLPTNFVASNSGMNPPPSYYMGIEGEPPTLGFWASGVEVPNNYGDDVPMLDYFNDDLYDSRGCSNTVDCIMQTVNKMLEINNNG